MIQRKLVTDNAGKIIKVCDDMRGEIVHKTTHIPRSVAKIVGAYAFPFEMSQRGAHFIPINLKFDRVCNHSQLQTYRAWHKVSKRREGWKLRRGQVLANNNSYRLTRVSARHLCAN